jgi:hypothetical protein
LQRWLLGAAEYGVSPPSRSLGINPASASIVFPAAIGISFCNQIILAAGRVFQTYEQLRVTASMNLLTNVLRLIAAVLMVAALHHATARQRVLTSLCVSFIGAMVAVATVSIRLGLPKFQLGLIRRHPAEGLQYSFSQSTSSVYKDLDKTMLSHYGLNIENGICSMAYRGVEIASIPIFSLRDAAVPRLFVQGAKGIQHSYALGRALLNRPVWLGLAVAAGMFLLAPIIPYVAGHGFAQSVNALRWLCLIPFFRSIHQMTGGSHRSRVAALSHHDAVHRRRSEFCAEPVAHSAPRLVRRRLGQPFNRWRFGHHELDDSLQTGECRKEAVGCHFGVIESPARTLFHRNTIASNRRFTAAEGSMMAVSLGIMEV